MDNYSYSESMSYDSLQNLRSYHPAWKLLSATSAPMILSFLYTAFVVSNCRELPEYSLVSKLNLHLNRIQVQSDAKELLTQWSDDKYGYLRKFYPPDSDEIHYDLTSATQKSIEWIMSLNERSFIGTESRLLLVFQLFYEIAQQSDEDPQRRIQELERRKAELEEEIIQVMQGHIKVLEPVQIKERYLQAMNLSREILSDFRALEQNFRDLRRTMQKKISRWDKGKGELIGDFFNSQDSIQQSDQGRSFQAFFDFLMSRAAQEDFEQTIREVGALDAVKELPGSKNAYRIIHDWVEGSKHVHDTLAVVSEQLRRYVDESFLEEERRISQIMKGILNSAITLRNEPPIDIFFEIDALNPKILLPFDRPLFTPVAYIKMDEPYIAYGDSSTGDDSILYSHISVNKSQLLNQIKHVLQDDKEVSLAQVINIYPVKLGLAEVIGYLSLAQDNPHASMLPQVNEPIFWEDTDGNTHKADFCRIVFHSGIIA